MPSPIVSNTTRFHRLLAPAFIGSAYALIKFWTLYSFGLLEKHQIDFFMLFLGGLMIGVCVRPFFQKVYWQHWASFFSALLLFACFGMPGILLEYWVWGQPLDMDFWKLRGIPELLASLGVSILVALLLTPPQRKMYTKNAFNRVNNRISLKILGQGLCFSFLFIPIFLFIRVGIHTEILADSIMEKVILFFESSSVSFLTTIACIWFRGIVLLIALFWITTMLWATRQELTMIAGMIGFVIGDFAPLVSNHEGVPSFILASQIMQGLLLHIIFCYLVIFFWGRGQEFLSQQGVRIEE